MKKINSPKIRPPKGPGTPDPTLYTDLAKVGAECTEFLSNFTEEAKAEAWLEMSKHHYEQVTGCSHMEPMIKSMGKDAQEALEDKKQAHIFWATLALEQANILNKKLKNT